MKSTADKLVADYLERLERALAGSPRAKRRELVEEISAHIAEGRAGLDPADEVATRELLDRLGDPEEIAAAAGGTPAGGGSRWKEITALVLLPIGGLVIPVVGWFVGVVLLWVSDAWNTRDKLIGTLLFPGGLLVPLGLGLVAEDAGGCGSAVNPQLSPQPDDAACAASGGTAAWEIALVVMLVLIPLATIVYLANRLRQRPAAVA